MKRNIFAIFALVICSALCFTACNSTPSVRGQFEEESYVVSLGDTINFYDELSYLKGVEKSNVVLEVSNDDILQVQANGDIVAKQSGKSFVFAKYRDMVFAETEVIVKYKFSTPTNFAVQEDGTLTWDGSYALSNDDIMYAQDYLLEYADITGLESIDESKLEFSEVKCQDSFVFSDFGSYYVKLTALGQEESYIDPSDASEGEIINYGVMGILENLSLSVSQEFGSDKATLSWDEKAEAVYQVYINGFKIQEGLEENSFSYDYSLIQNAQSINIRVIAEDKNSVKLASATSFDMTKLNSPESQYTVKGKDQTSYIYFEGVDGASGYMLHLENIGSGHVQDLSLSEDDISYINLEGLESGLYSSQIISVGGKVTDDESETSGFFLSSDPSQNINIAKLATPSPKITFEGSTAIFEFNEDDYNDRYLISYASEQQIVTGSRCEINLAALRPDEYTFKVTALPKLSGSEVVPYQQNDLSTSVIVSSDPYTFDFAILEPFTTLSHSLTLEQDVSTFTFNRIDGSNYYEIYINGSLVEDASFEENGQYITTKIANLNEIAPVDNKYTIKVVAGLREEGVEHAVLSTCEKTLTILSAVSESQEQVNGLFMWKALDNDYVYYEYQIFKTESDYVVSPDAVAVQEGGTSENVINEELEFGYYVIRVKSISTNYDNYLDSSFYDENNYFEGNFLVYKQIETPKVSFVNDSGSYKLLINSVDYAGGFDVYVDDTLEKSITFTSDSGQAEYVFLSDFAQAKTYNIDVVANSGQSYDDALHTQSEPYSLTVTRLSQPQFDVSEETDLAGRKTAENLTVTMIENASYAVIEIDGVVVNGIDNSNVCNLIGQDNDFLVGLHFVAGQADGDDYYLDSHTREITFNRVSAPTNINFQDGMLTWENSDANVENYYLAITLVNSVNGNYYNRMFIEGNGTELDLQELVNTLCSQNLTFASNYQQAESVMLELSAHRNSFVDDIYYLPSIKGTTSLGQNALTIYKLGAANITFNADDLIVSWSQVAAGAVYDIYVGGRLVKEDYTNVSINLSDLGDIDFGQAQSIYVKSKHATHLNSTDSNTIFVKELASIDSINISSNDGENYISFELSQDLSNTQSVLVNGSSDNVNYQAGNSGGNFNLADFVGTEVFTFQVMPQNSSDTYFYYRSKQTSFTLTDLSKQEFTPVLSDDIISWNDIASDFVGENINPITYLLTITCNGERYSITTTAHEQSLQTIEAQIGVLLNKNVEIVVTARVSASYTLTGQGARGYYGENSGQAISTEKLAQISSINLQIVDNSSEPTLIGAKSNAYVTLSWQDLWEDIENVNFEVTISSGNASSLIVVTDGTVHASYKLTRADGNYLLTIYSGLLSGETTTFAIRVAATNYITSESTEKGVSKIDEITDISVDQDGILTITDDGNYSYVLQVTIGEKIAERSYSFTGSNKQIDLMVDGLLKDGYGGYSILLLAYDENLQLLPSTVKRISGDKLQGIKSCQIRDDGYVYFDMYMDDFSDMQFIFQTKINGGTYRITAVPDGTEMGTNYYTIYALDLMNIFSNVLSGQAGEYVFEAAIYKKGSVRSDFITLTINYQIDENPTLSRGLDLTKDYIVFNIPENDDTVSINVKLNVYDGTSYQATNDKISFAAEEVRGYWCVNSETGDEYFSKTRDDSLENVTFTECYAVSVNDILANYDCGFFYLQVARLGKSGDEYISYANHSVEMFKLNRVNDDVEVHENLIVRIQGNNLLWEWEAEEGYGNYAFYKPTAYYIIFEAQEEGDNETFQVVSYASSYDLQEANLTPGKTYNIYVVAASSTNQVVASDRSKAVVSVMKYTTPLSLDVTNGMITFDDQEFLASEFMSEITNYFSSSSHQEYLYNLMGDRVYTNPLYFYTSDLSSSTLTLRFTLKDSTGADTSTFYELNLPARYLFPDIEIKNSDLNVSGSQNISYFELLQAYANTIAGVSTTAAVNFKSMVTTLMNSNRGYAGNNILFDDFGRAIPSGEYSLTVYQRGLNNSTIDSDMSRATTVFITASPSMSLSQGNDSEGGIIYTATFGTTETYVADQFDAEGNATSYIRKTATQYRMLIRYSYSYSNHVLSYDGGLAFNLVYLEGSGWNIYFNGRPLAGVITNVAASGDVPGFKIDITALRTAVDGIEGQSIRTNTAMRVDIYALSGDNGYVVNGKSAFFNLRYLDLPTDSITFQGGTMYIKTSDIENAAILMRYLATGSEQAQKIIQMTNGIAYIDLPREGAYRYIVLSLNGSISYNTINVGSKTYAIENLYKLNSPSMSTRNNNIYVTYNSNDFAYTQNQSLQFYLANDISMHDGTGYYYSSLLYRGASNAITYEVGSKNPSGQTMYSSELNATEFYSYLLGNSGYFESSVAGDNTAHGADYIWTFMTLNSTGDKYVNAAMLFTSETAYVKAGMLNVINGNVYISHGNVKWDEIKDSPAIENGEIIYKVSVNYYKQVIGDNEFDVTYEYQLSDIYYTAQTNLAADYISQDYDYYTIDVTPMGGKVLSSEEGQSDVRAIKTIEGNYYLIYESVYYQDKATQVLKGNTATLGSATAPISRTSTPILSPSDTIINNGVSNGNIIYYITTEDYGGTKITDELNRDVAARTMIRARYTQAGQEHIAEVSGTFVFESGSGAGTSGYIMVIFTPSEGQLNDISPLDILIQMYSGDKLISKDLVIKNVYKMSALQDGYYEIRLSGDSTIIDFTNYFRYVTIASDNTFYQIVIEYTTPEGNHSSVITSSSSVKTFEIASNITNITIQVRDNQATSTVNRLLLLYSDSLRYRVEQTEVSSSGENLIEISWNSQDSRFEWNWTDERDNTYEYYYEIVTEGVGKTSGTTPHNYYMPHDRGTITSFLVKARQVSEEESGGQSVLYVYSESISYDGTAVVFDLFSGGNGSQMSPYLISNADDFYNISKRNVSDEVFYFRFTTNIEIDFNEMAFVVTTDEGSEINFLIKEFYGSLDGNGYRLTFAAKDLYDMDEPYSTNITGLGTLNFTKYFALFETIAPNATVSSLNIYMDVDLTDLDNSYAVIAPLALYNYGNLSGVNVNGLTISRLTGERNANYIFVGGMVALNYGTITNCINNSDVSLVMPQRIPLYMGYAGIALFNLTEGDYVGTISNSFNRGDLSLTATTSNVNIYGSGIVINNAGVLDRVGNDGNFFIDGTVSCAAYFTGIALHSEGASLSYCYNNGQFTGSSSASLYTAGIAYTLNGGTINYLVDTQGYALAAISRSTPTDTGINYAGVSSGTTVINVVELTSIAIDCGDGFYLRIQLSSGSYVASIGR